MKEEWLKKQQVYANRCVLLLCGIFLIVLVSAVILVPRAYNVLKQMERTLSQIESSNLIANLDELEKLDVEQFNEMISEASDKIQALDPEKINDALDQMNAAAQNIEKLTRPLSGLFSKDE